MRQQAIVQDESRRDLAVQPHCPLSTGCSRSSGCVPLSPDPEVGWVQVRESPRGDDGGKKWGGYWVAPLSATLLELELELLELMLLFLFAVFRGVALLGRRPLRRALPYDAWGVRGD